MAVGLGLRCGQEYKNQLKYLNEELADTSVISDGTDINELKTEIKNLQKIYSLKLKEAKRTNNIIDIEIYSKELDNEQNNLADYYAAILKLIDI